MGQVHWENNEQIKTALLYLEHLCPLKPTDQPLDINCEDSVKARPSTTLPLSLSEAEISNWLNSPSVYVRLAAIISSRSLPKISPDLEKKIKNPVIYDMSKDGEMIKVLSDSIEKAEGDK